MKEKKKLNQNTFLQVGRETRSALQGKANVFTD